MDFSYNKYGIVHVVILGVTSRIHHIYINCWLPVYRWSVMDKQVTSIPPIPGNGGGGGGGGSGYLYLHYWSPVDWEPAINVDMVYVHVLNYDVYLSVMVVLILARSVDPDEMQHYVAFHLGLHCLPKYLMDQKNLNNLRRRSCKDHLYQK